MGPGLWWWHRGLVLAVPPQALFCARRSNVAGQGETRGCCARPLGVPKCPVRGAGAVPPLPARPQPSNSHHCCLNFDESAGIQGWH